MEINIVTKEDLKRGLEELRQQLLADMQELLSGKSAGKQWMKSDEVRKMLGVSTGTLQNLRIAGKLNPSKIGGIHYYKLSEIEALLTSQ
jgi:hypothetical protein